MSGRARTAGFTLIEMLAVMLLVGIVVSAATTFYFQLSRQSNQAAEDTRVARRATAVLDRLARELENAVLVVKPEERDPLEHPWLFFAEREGGGEGADRLKFVTRGHRSRADGVHESDLATVAWALREDGDSGALVRWTQPRLPEGLDRRVPEEEEEGAQLVVEDVASFGLRFLTEEGQWKESWDSSTLDSSRLPLAVEIALALDPAPGPGDDPTFEPEPLRRQVVLPLRPLDLQALLGEGDEDGIPGDGDEEGEEGESDDAFDDGTGEEETALGDEADGDEDQECRVTVAQCASAHPELLQQVGPEFQSLLQSFGGACATDFAGRFPVPPDCL